MAEKSFPLENTLYTAADAQLWMCTRTTGVYTNAHLGVTANGTMAVTLGPGIAWLHYDDYGGCVYGNTDDKALTVEMSDGSQNRIDRVCIRLEILNNKCYAYIKKGTPAATPSAPALQRNNLAYEISVAQIYVGVGVTKINAANITDERLNSDVCGLMRDGVTGIDTSMMQNQFTSALNNMILQVNQTVSSTQTQANALLNELQENIQTVYDTVEKVNLMELTGTLSASGWSASAPYTQDVAATGVLSSDKPFLDVDLTGVTALASMQALNDAFAGILGATAGANKITAVFGSKPTIDVPIKIKVVR